MSTLMLLMARRSPLISSNRFNLCDQFSIAITQLRLIQKIGPVVQRLLQRRTPSPAPDVVMVAVQQNFRNLQPSKLRRTRIVRII